MKGTAACPAAIGNAVPRARWELFLRRPARVLEDRLLRHDARLWFARSFKSGPGHSCAHYHACVGILTVRSRHLLPGSLELKPLQQGNLSSLCAMCFRLKCRCADPTIFVRRVPSNEQDTHRRDCQDEFANLLGALLPDIFPAELPGVCGALSQAPCQRSKESHVARWWIV